MLSSLTGRFTKDLITDPRGTATTDLRLTTAEMQEVYGTLRAVDIWSYPSDFRPDPHSTPGVGTVHVSTYQSYFLLIRSGGLEKQIRWEDDGESEDPRAVALRTLFARIQQLIEAKPE